MTAHAIKPMRPASAALGIFAMDAPRFKQIEGSADCLHERYHGGRLVTLLFAIVDGWRGGGGPSGMARRAVLASTAALMAKSLRRRDG